MVKENFIMKKALYLSIDGLLDPLGQSQIFPYIKKLSENNIFFYICTIENKKNKNKLKKFNNEIRKYPNTNWKYAFFSKKKGKFNRILELSLLYLIFIKTIFNKKDRYNSLQKLPTNVYLFTFKNFFKKKIIFDTRGSWFDERIDGGMLKTSGLDFLVYKFLKKLSIYYLKYLIMLFFLLKNQLQQLIKIIF